MNLKAQPLPLIDNVKAQVVGAAQEITESAPATLVLVSVGVIATIQDSVNGLLHDRG